MQAIFVEEAHGQQFITTCGASTGKSYYLVV
jgi:hypothetical protein